MQLWTPFRYFPESQRSIIRKSQEMRPNPLDVTLEMRCMRASSSPRSYVSPRLNGICAFVAFCSWWSTSSLCSESPHADLTLYVSLHTCPADHATACPAQIRLRTSSEDTHRHTHTHTQEQGKQPPQTQQQQQQ